MITTNIEFPTWFDRLPTELIFLIFNYLSSNDIIYTFFFFSQRLNNLLLENERYFQYLDLPRTNLDTWKNIFSVIRSRVESLNINTVNLSFPLSYFSNLKSIIISSSYGFPEEQFKLIFESEYFTHLHSLKIKTNKLFSSISSNNYSINRYHVLEKVFSHKSSLRTFECLSIITRPEIFDKISFKTNLNLHSLTLVLTDYEHIFRLISYTPNLEYLNIQTKLPHDRIIPINKINIKLKELYLTLKETSFVQPNHFEQLINDIKQFSSSLICLSLNLVGLSIDNIHQFPFNSIKLQQFLESIRELKQFHLYARLRQGEIDSDTILSEFKNEYWFNHNWSFGMHRDYFYTLPFHFDYLYHFPNSFDDIKSSNPEILITNPRIWYYIKFISLPITLRYNLNIIKEFKIKMPKLTFIKFDSSYDCNIKTREGDFQVNKDEIVTLNNVTTIKCTRTSLEDIEEWLIYALPNLKHWILDRTNLPSIDSKLNKILNKRVERLTINKYFQLEQLAEISYFYFSTVQYIDFFLNTYDRTSKLSADIIMKLFDNLNNWQQLIIYDHEDYARRDLDKIIEYLDMEEITKNYQMKHFHECLLFLKQECDNVNIQNGIISSALR